MLGIIEAALRASLSGAATGGVVGGGLRFLKGGKQGDIIRSMLKGTAVGGAAAGGSQLIGSSIMGAPDEESDGSPYAVRGALGGALGGGSIGALIGMLIANGKIPRLPMKTPQFITKAGQAIMREIPTNNMVVDKLRALGQAPTLEKIRKGAAYGGLMGAVPGALIGADEGQVVDTVLHEYQNQKAKERWSTPW
jgi:hypothetical protein